MWACEIILLDCIRYLCPGDKTPSKQSMGIEICVQDLSAAIFKMEKVCQGGCIQSHGSLHW